MREGDRSECRLTHRSGVQLDTQAVRDRAFVDRGQLHEHVVGMLPVVEGLVVAELAGGEEIRVAALAGGHRVGAQHRPQRHLSAEERAPGHPHRPVRRSELLPAAVPAVVEIVDVEAAVQHQLPPGCLSVEGVHGARVGKPRRARALPVARLADRTRPHGRHRPASPCRGGGIRGHGICGRGMLVFLGGHVSRCKQEQGESQPPRSCHLAFLPRDGVPRKNHSSKAMSAAAPSATIQSAKLMVFPAARCGA